MPLPTEETTRKTAVLKNGWEKIGQKLLPTQKNMPTQLVYPVILLLGVHGQ